MTQIYYKNPQNIFKKLTYKDFGAAAAYHTHTAADIQVIDYNNESKTIAQIAEMEQGGIGMSTLNPIKSAKVLAASEDKYNFSQVLANTGVLGYYDGIDKLPSFQTWPIAAGGTGVTNQTDAIAQFDIGITNTASVITDNDTDWSFSLNNYHIVDAFLTNDKTYVVFSIYLPFQLLPNTTGYLELYPLIISQPNTTTASNYYCPTYSYTDYTVTPTPTIATAPALEGFKASFATDQTVTSAGCIHQYGYNDNGMAGYVNPTISEGNVEITTYSGGPVYENNKLVYYQTGHIIDVVMKFDNISWNTNFGNNRPLILALGKGLNSIKNQLVIENPKIIRKGEDDG